MSYCDTAFPLAACADPGPDPAYTIPALPPELVALGSLNAEPGADEAWPGVLTAEPDPQLMSPPLAGWPAAKAVAGSRRQAPIAKDATMVFISAFLLAELTCWNVSPAPCTAALLRLSRAH
jgi:hypothetical protein